MHVVTLCGSLRHHSSNRAVLEAFQRLAPPEMAFDPYNALDRLPHFDPDVDDDHLPEPVIDFRRRINAADIVVISTPEYAHGLPGVLKNALDWLVGDPAFAGKRVVILHLDRGSRWAYDSLHEILRTMSARIDGGAGALLPLPSNQVDADTLLAQPALRQILQRSLTTLVAGAAP
jgi:NAD(P)H-dependent FMN reductase